MGKWAAAFPQVRDLLSRPGSETEMDQRLHWLLTVGEQALQEGSRAEALRAVQEAQPYLRECGESSPTPSTSWKNRLRRDRYAVTFSPAPWLLPLCHAASMKPTISTVTAISKGDFFVVNSSTMRLSNSR